MQNQFLLLDKWLTGQEKLWRFEPFHQSLHSQLPWLDTHPEMCAWLESLTPHDLSHYKSNTSSLVEQLGRFIPVSKAVLAAISLEPFSTANIGLDKRLDIGIPGRKLRQIEAMGSYSLAFHQGKEWLEWCSGKGYLGRVLASKTGQRVTSLEFQSSLCERGQSEANALNLPIHFVQGDALEPTSKQYFKADQHAVALHACGDLHVRLMEYGCEQQLAAITLAPCCYHLVQNPSYQAISTMAKSSNLKLSRSELRIPLQQTVTGGQRVQRHRELEMSFRLGLDLLLRHECDLLEYMPVPSIKKSQLSLGFEAFCKWAADVKGFHLPKVSFAQYEKSGVERFWRMESLSLVQQIFQRALEMWLIYDKAMYLQEQGYDVSLCEFCERDITPRNIIIHASRSKKSQ